MCGAGLNTCTSSPAKPAARSRAAIDSAARSVSPVTAFDNAYAERFVRSIKEECLSRVVPLGEAHVRQLVYEFVEHYHHERNHQGRDNQLLQRPPPPVNPDTDVERRERLGGLLSFYYREVARGGG